MDTFVANVSKSGVRLGSRVRVEYQLALLETEILSNLKQIYFANLRTGEPSLITK